MKKLLKIALITVVTVVVLAIVALAVVKAVYLDDLIPEIEKSASEATGLDIKIGDIGLDVLPSLAVAVEDIHVKGEKSEVLSLGEVDISVELGPLLSKKLEITNVRVVEPNINIVRGKDGKYNFEGKKVKKEKPKEPAGEGGPPLAGVLAQNISVVKGNLTYTDEASNSKTEVKDFDINVRDVSLEGLSEKQDVSALMKSIGFKGDLKVADVVAGNYRVSDISSDYVWKEGVFDIKPMKFSLYGGQADGTCSIDLRGKKPRVKVTQDVKGLDLGRVVKETSGKDALAGKTDLKAKLSMTGASPDEVKRSLSGTITMQGTDMIIKGVDLDASLAKIKDTQSFNLFDAGSFFVLGPLGPLLSKGAGFAGVAADTAKGDQSVLTKYIFDWTVGGGMVTTKDVAFATKENRIAFDGQLDIVNERFADLKAAVLKPDGCSKFEQTIVGPFNKPTVKKSGIVKSVLKPITSLFGAVVPKGECKPFYQGSIEHPVPATGG
jgi:AsmA protein